MRRIDGNSDLKAKARLVLAVLMLGAARVHAQESEVSAQPAKRQILVSLADRKLALIEDGQVLKVYPVAIGRKSSPSPSGTFKIINRVTDPTYYHKGEVIEPGPENPVGTRWIGLSQKGYGIHGTNAPRSIGKAVSHGCIRMARKDLEELFSLVRAGDVVEIRGERDSETAAVFGTAPEPVVVATATLESSTSVATR